MAEVAYIKLDNERSSQARNVLLTIVSPWMF